MRERVPDVPASRPVRGLPRRDALRLAAVAAAGAALAACTTSPGPGPTASPGAPDDPDLTLRAEVAEDEAALSELYAASAAALPTALRTKVTALGARHTDYRAAVLAGATVSPSPSASPTGSASGGGSASAVLSRLRAAERNAAASRAEQSARAQSAELARTIVLAGTGAASAAEYLRGLG